jgi:CheY-like chemotaxis protein
MLLENKKIVYIEDDPRNRDLVQLLLSAEGATIWFERWGTPATSLSTILTHMPLDLILLDLMFAHGYSGYLIFDVLKRQGILERVPVVMISASDPSLEMPKARQVGLSGYIAKPVDATNFAKLIQDAIAGEKVWVA